MVVEVKKNVLCLGAHWSQMFYSLLMLGEQMVAPNSHATKGAWQQPSKGADRRLVLAGVLFCAPVPS